MRRPLAGAIASVAALLSWAHAGAQTPCGPRDDIVAQLAERFGERQVSLALDTRGAVVETFANAETGSWSVLATRPGGPSCLILFGYDFQAAPGDAPGQPS